MRLLSHVVTAIRKRRAELQAEDTKLQAALQALAGTKGTGTGTSTGTYTTPLRVPAVKREFPTKAWRMSKAQRQAVSVRMKAYWRTRRAASGGKGKG